mmetsp:Transcript_14824/g.21199  ORF Transcript_14824/g.21199 Transcript_14824/m.21199 type:complete len:963 (-) Transcript_14824:109-2997(-)|eukprot:CAMPEP_0184857486 /NCGR_PEP_ID=MMETSP0580-20130426/2636_1 /TAXON_ID=1118495 /ORGANISM="Dactyliosolen fragilissimus" /LENGTH=962 /DNA_ID=CAMNT_0027353103 /DNA_START=337 /DNA_END=3225 /DNA_ORIENTATION=+
MLSDENVTNYDVLLLPFVAPSPKSLLHNDDHLSLFESLLSLDNCLAENHSVEAADSKEINTTNYVPIDKDTKTLEACISDKLSQLSLISPVQFASSTHVGNHRFAISLSMHRQNYLRARIHGDYQKCRRIACDIIKTYCEDSIPRGRFLEFDILGDSDRWFVLGNHYEENSSKIDSCNKYAQAETFLGEVHDNDHIMSVDKTYGFFRNNLLGYESLVDRIEWCLRYPPRCPMDPVLDDLNVDIFDAIVPDYLPHHTHSAGAPRSTSQGANVHDILLNDPWQKFLDINNFSNISFTSTLQTSVNGSEKLKTLPDKNFAISTSSSVSSTSSSMATGCSSSTLRSSKFMSRKLDYVNLNDDRFKVDSKVVSLVNDAIQENKKNIEIMHEENSKTENVNNTSRKKNIDPNNKKKKFKMKRIHLRKSSNHSESSQSSLSLTSNPTYERDTTNTCDADTKVDNDREGSLESHQFLPNICKNEEKKRRRRSSLLRRSLENLLFKKTVDGKKQPRLGSFKLKRNSTKSQIPSKKSSLSGRDEKDKCNHNEVDVMIESALSDEHSSDSNNSVEKREMIKHSEEGTRRNSALSSGEETLEDMARFDSIYKTPGRRNSRKESIVTASDLESQRMNQSCMSKSGTILSKTIKNRRGSVQCGKRMSIMSTISMSSILEDGEIQVKDDYGDSDEYDEDPKGLVLGVNDSTFSGRRTSSISNIDSDDFDSLSGKDINSDILPIIKPGEFDFLCQLKPRPCLLPISNVGNNRLRLMADMTKERFNKNSEHENDEDGDEPSDCKSKHKEEIMSALVQTILSNRKAGLFFSIDQTTYSIDEKINWNIIEDLDDINSVIRSCLEDNNREATIDFKTFVSLIQQEVTVTRSNEATQEDLDDMMHLRNIPTKLLNKHKVKWKKKDKKSRTDAAHGNSKNMSTINLLRMHTRDRLISGYNRKRLSANLDIDKVKSIQMNARENI